MYQHNVKIMFDEEKAFKEKLDEIKESKKIKREEIILKLKRKKFNTKISHA